MMKTKNAKWKIFLVTLLIFIIVYMMMDPYRRTEKVIRDNLLKKTPIGSSADKVLQFILTDLKHEHNTEPYYNEAAPAMDLGPQGYTIPIGKKSIEVQLDTYWSVPGFPVRKSVFASWAFNENNKLTDILVHKENDAL